MNTRFLSSLFKTVCILLTALAVSGCNVVYEPEVPCTRTLRVPLSYTMNMAFADALPRQVREVTLYAAQDGNIVKSYTKGINELADNGYAIDIDLPPGDYDLLAWGKGESPVENPVGFDIPVLTLPMNISELSATLPLSGTGGDKRSDHDIVPLFHAFSQKVSLPDEYGVVTLPVMDMTKDTHIVQVMIATADGATINPGDFSFAIEADNSKLSYRNDVISDSPFRYLPWNVTPLSASRDDDEVNALRAELSTGRLTTDRTPTLVISRITDKTDIIRLNLIEYLLLIKGEYNRNMTDQEYLDRNDTYSLIFFLNSASDWDRTAGIFINGWRVVPPQSDDV